MSLMGIDVGSSSVKIGAYREDGPMIAMERADLIPQHPQPGWWEQDPEQVWQAVHTLVGTLMRHDELQRDPPRAVAICASVRENFPTDKHGNPLASCIMAADIRGAEFEIPPEDEPLPEPWAFSCGHMRERMDPFSRLLWWHDNQPGIIRQATYFPGWHEFLALRMCGRYAADPAIASRWQVFDLNTKNWALDRLADHDLDARFLPEVLPWGTMIGKVKQELLEDWGISAPFYLAVGSSDLNGSALGAGVSSVGEICMSSGSFENMLIATTELPSATMLLRGLSITPHPGSAGRAVWAICPTGTAVLNWARNLTGVSIEQLDQQLAEVDPSPSHVLAIPYLSGAFIYWPDGRKLHGAIFGLTLASKPIDIIRAFMESIAYDHVNTLSLLQSEGVIVESIRAMGGGSRSRWWTQLKSDMMGIPIDVIHQTEPGTLGAAMLAGLAIGCINDLTEACRALSSVARHYDPHPGRQREHQKKLARYRRAIQQILEL